MKKAVLILTALLLVVPLSATSLSDKKNQLSSAEQDIKDRESKVTEKQEEQSGIKEEVKQIDLEMVEIESQLSKLDADLELKQLELEQSEADLETATVQKDEQYEATKARMVQMYKNQQIGYMQVIFSSNSFWDAINRMEYVKRISNKDNTLLEEYQEQIESIEVQKQKVEQDKMDLDDMQQEALASKSALDTVKSKKEAAMNQLAAEEGKLRSEIEDLKEISDQLKDEINTLTKQLEEAQKKSSSSIKIPTQYVGGTFMWPVPGYYRVSSDYVNRTSPISGKAEFHSGIDIPAGYGSDVVAAADGVVITSGWVNGYGYTIMISHGSGLVTLYGHNSSLVAQKGATVKKGQVVAKIGSTGWSTGNHCHFEVRVNGDHTSPWPYLND